jgi:hypothetical protein
VRSAVPGHTSAIDSTIATASASAMPRPPSAGANGAAKARAATKLAMFEAGYWSSEVNERVTSRISASICAWCLTSGDFMRERLSLARERW